MNHHFPVAIFLTAKAPALLPIPYRSVKFRLYFLIWNKYFITVSIICFRLCPVIIKFPIQHRIHYRFWGTFLFTSSACTVQGPIPLLQAAGYCPLAGTALSALPPLKLNPMIIDFHDLWPIPSITLHFLRNNNRRYEICHQAGSPPGDAQYYPYNPYQRRVNTHIFTNSSAYSTNHPVGL